jgi:hypothetical protein
VSDGIRKRAKRDNWSNAKLTRALKDIQDDWSGLDPRVRESLANVADVFGRVAIFLFWSGKGGGTNVREEMGIDANTLRSDPFIVEENRLVIAAGNS